MTVNKEILGLSTTGSKHGVLIESKPGAAPKLTITGHNGKRHAAVLLPPAALRELAETLLKVADQEES